MVFKNFVYYFRKIVWFLKIYKFDWLGESRNEWELRSIDSESWFIYIYLLYLELLSVLIKVKLLILIEYLMNLNF